MTDHITFQFQTNIILRMDCFISMMLLHLYELNGNRTHESMTKYNHI